MKWKQRLHIGKQQPKSVAMPWSGWPSIARLEALLWAYCYIARLQLSSWL
jgi:hypothetical protein